MEKSIRHLFFVQKSNNHKPKLLHVEGMVLLVILVAIWQIGVKAFTVGAGPLPAVLGFASTVTIDQVVAATNAKRQADGLSTLSFNPQLAQAAIAKGNDMCTNQYWAHVSPTGTTPWVFMKNSGYKYSVAGENLARDFADTGSMMSAWISSIGSFATESLNICLSVLFFANLPHLTLSHNISYAAIPASGNFP